VKAEDAGEDEAPMLWRPLGREWCEEGYGEEPILDEAAFIAYHLHWDLDRILGMEHLERRRWVAMVSQLNQQANDQLGNLVN
jgi:hypothetical protein